MQLSRYINVYRDKDGEIHYSTEEFGIGKDGIHSIEDAAEEVFFLTVMKKSDKWEYITTLTNIGAEVSAVITKKVADAENALTAMEIMGICTAHLATMDSVWAEYEEANA